MTRYAFKIVLCGDGAVGKTSLRRRFMGDTFIANHLATIGADFSAKKIVIDEESEIEFQIWDLAGQPNFKSIRSRFYGGARGSICVIDLTNPQSLRNLPIWIDELFKHSGFGAVPLIIVGNKVDLEEERKISRINVMELMDKLREQVPFEMEYIETSAKTGENVQEVFFSFATQLKNISEDLSKNK